MNLPSAESVAASMISRAVDHAIPVCFAILVVERPAA
jgi:hypothetical protein